MYMDNLIEYKPIVNELYNLSVETMGIYDKIFDNATQPSLFYFVLPFVYMVL